MLRRGPRRRRSGLAAAPPFRRGARSGPGGPSRRPRRRPGTRAAGTCADPRGSRRDVARVSLTCNKGEGARGQEGRRRGRRGGGLKSRQECPFFGVGENDDGSSNGPQWAEEGRPATSCGSVGKTPARAAQPARVDAARGGCANRRGTAGPPETGTWVRKPLAGGARQRGARLRGAARAAP